MLAQQMRIQSIPTVYAFYQGQPVDGFMGALPESQIQAFIDKMVALSGAQPGAGDAEAASSVDLDTILEQADAALAAGATEQARELYRAVLGEDHSNVKAYSGYARAMLADNRLSEVQAMMEQIP